MSKQQPLPFNPIIWPAVPHDFAGNLNLGNNLGYYATEDTQRYVWGTRGMTWDGKVYRYGRAKGTVYAGYGAANTATVDVTDLLNTNHTKTIEIGDRSVLFSVTSGQTFNGGGIAEDELVGAMYVVGHGAAATTETRTVIGNDAIAGTTTAKIMIYVDAPFAIQHTTGFNELPLNPYAYLKQPYAVCTSVMGVPNVIATSGQNVWIQTWGLCFVVPGNADTTIADSPNHRTAYFVGDGSVNGGDITTATSYQIAGFVTDSTEAGTGCMPMVMLQISI